MKVKYEALNFYSHRMLVRIEGFRIEKFLSEAADRGIVMRGMKVLSDTEVEGWVAAADVKTLKKLSKSLYCITLLDSKGPEHEVRRLAKRPVTIAGILLAGVIVAVQSLFVCTIEIDGYRAIPEDSLRRCLEQAGIYEGAFRPEIDWEIARESLRSTFPQITWVQLVYDGRTVLLNIAESQSRILSQNAEPGSDIFVPSSETEQVYCHFVADRDGYIESISTLWGAAQVEEGDFVKEGDILISGVVPMEPTTFQEDWPTEYYVRAKGEVTAIVPYRLTFNQERYMSSGHEEENLIADRREKTREQAEEVANQQIRLWIKENLPENAEILNKSLNFSYKKNIIEIGVTLEVRQQIGYEKEILVGQEDSDN